MKARINTELVLLFTLLITIFLASCNKDADVVMNKVVTGSQLSTLKAVRGVNGGLTTDSKSKSLTGKMGPDSLFLSQNPLVEYKYNIAIDYEEVFTYEINESNDTISTTSVINELSRDTLSITSGPIWLPFDAKNEVALKVGLKKEFLDPNLNLNVIIDVVDDLGPLFTQLLNNDATWSADNITFGNDIYQVVENIPRYNVNGKILNETDGMIIPRFGVREFDTGLTEVTRDFEITITTSTGSVVVAPFSIKFVSLSVYNNRQCWLSGAPECSTLFNN